MSLLTKAGRYWHTLRHLRPVQFYGRIWFRYSHPKPDLRPAPNLRVRSARWQLPAQRAASLTGPRSFVFLNEVGGVDEIAWDGPQREKLWRYNQHYFDDLNALGAAERRAWHLALIEDWMAHNPVGQGNAWEPYPASLRIVNWIKWALSGGELSAAARHSLAVQVRWLTGRLEIHLLGNHLFANAKALLFAGLFFHGPETDRWRETALRILQREVPEQILPDGGQFELSTMYHALALEDALDLLNLLSCFDPATAMGECSSLRDMLLARVGAMRHWLRVMCHPDGEIALFNDAAIGIAPAVAELDAYFARCLPQTVEPRLQRVERLCDSGYVRLSSGVAVALLDVARVGPDYLPGHAHADTLSFELSLFGQRVLVNSGTSCYGMSAERLRQRGTAAHNTVVVEGEDSSEVWGGFRVARRARPIELELVDAEVAVVSCGHDGYQRFAGAPTHWRTWSMSEHSLLIEDSVDGRFGNAEARYHLHPEARLELGPQPNAGLIRLAGGETVRWTARHGRVRSQPSTYHPRFGTSQPSQCLVVELVAGLGSLEIEWD